MRQTILTDSDTSKLPSPATYRHHLMFCLLWGYYANVRLRVQRIVHDWILRVEVANLRVLMWLIFVFTVFPDFSEIVEFCVNLIQQSVRTNKVKLACRTVFWGKNQLLFMLFICFNFKRRYSYLWVILCSCRTGEPLFLSTSFSQSIFRD